VREAVEERHIRRWKRAAARKEAELASRWAGLRH
jgi:hypothetical protein